MRRSDRFCLFFSLTYFLIIMMLYLLQISEFPWFFVWLVLMHAGIIILVILKRRFKELDVKKYYIRAYVCFGLFIPILAYKVIAGIWKFGEYAGMIRCVSLGIIVISAFIGIYNILGCYRHQAGEN